MRRPEPTIRCLLQRACAFLAAAVRLPDRSACLRAWLLLPALGLAGQAALALDVRSQVSEYSVTAWTMEEGLPHNFVQAVAQDRDGYLWIGSWEGAARFNGRRFTAFDDRTTPGVPLTAVRAILADDDGGMLFGTAQQGVIRFGEGQWSVLEATREQQLRVLSLLRLHSGELWIGTDQTIWSLGPDGQLEDLGTKLGLAESAVFSMLDLGPPGVLIGTEYGLLRIRDGQIDAFGNARGLDNSHVHALLQRRSGELVIGNEDGAFVLADDRPAQRIYDASVEALIEDDHGTLWLSLSLGGLARWHEGQIQVIGASMNLVGRSSQALVMDHAGQLWLGTTNGLYRIADAPAYGLDASAGLGDNYPRTILRHSDGRMFVGHSRGLDVWRDDHFEAIHLESMNPSVLTIGEAADGCLWIGTYNRGVLHVDPDGVGHGPGSTAIQDGLPSRHVRALLEAADGSLWIGTTNGLVRRHPDGRVERIAESNGRTDGFVQGIIPARDGGLWIGFANALAHWHPERGMAGWDAASGFPASSSFDILETERGNVFIGTNRGLVRFHDGAFTLFDRDRGLPNENIFRILRDPDGAVWLSSNRGVFRIDPGQFRELDEGTRERLAVDIIDHADGLPSSQSNGGSWPAGNLDASGRLWIPTALGVGVIDPRVAAARSRVSIPVRIESLQADARHLDPALKHQLAASTRRVVLRYIGLHLQDPLGVRYRYRMVGFDEDWVEAGTNTTAVYTNLPSGHLRFEVQASTGSLGWSTARKIQTATVRLEQRKPWWLEPWMGGLLIVPISILALAMVAGLSARARRQQAVLERVIRERTRELSRANRELRRAGSERESLLQQLAYQATHDELTGLPNRRAAEQQLTAAIEAAAQSGSPLCVALVDIDRFKRVNDEFGHHSGDQLLQHIATQLAKASFVPTDYAARYGGEEFLLILPETELGSAASRLDALRQRIAQTPARLRDGRELVRTVSIGVVAWQPGLSMGELIIAADRCMYAAKQGGRNRVIQG